MYLINERLDIIQSVPVDLNSLVNDSNKRTVDFVYNIIKN